MSDTPPSGLDYNSFRRWRKTNGITGTLAQISSSWKQYSASVTKKTPPKEVAKKTPPKTAAKTSTGRRGRPPKKTLVQPSPRKSPPKSPKKTPPKPSPKKASPKPSPKKMSPGVVMKSPKKSPLKTPPKQVGIQSGSHSITGRRVSNEDTHIEMPTFMENTSLFGVFDGHGGKCVSKYLEQHFAEELKSAIGSNKTISEAITSAFESMDKKILAEKTLNCGSTGVIALVTGDEVYLAWAGDSRSIVVRNGKVILATEDHKPNLPRERKRIEDAGGAIFHMGVWRLATELGLSTSRSFGDEVDKQFIIATPDIVNTKIETGDIIVLACDGLWDVLTNEQVAVFVTNNTSSPKFMANKLVTIAYDSWSGDNITAIVVRV